MIQVNVKYFNILAAYAGTRKQSIKVKEGMTIFDFILQISRDNPPPFQEVVLQDGKPSPHLRVFRNNQLVDPELFNTPLLENDEILLFPAVAGGAHNSSHIIPMIVKEH